MPAARGVKRAASKSSAPTVPTVPKNKKKRGAIQLEIPSAPKKRGRVLTCGQGDVGQLGLGPDVAETNKFKYVTALGDKIVDVYAGGMHTVALDSSGKVWTFGCNDEGALGRATAGDEDEAAPRAVPLPARAVQLAAGDSHSAALLATGDVYAWGAFRDSHGCMGLVVRGREGKSCREPVKVDVGEPAAGIASGGDHLVILSTSGAVYTMGCGEQGQLGRLPQRSASREARQGFSALLVPSKVTLKGGARRVWAGYHATFLLDGQSDKLLAFGLNNYGQLGISGEKRKTALYSPMECDAFTSVGSCWRAVACGQHHSLALDDSGQVYAIGRCEYGRLGLGDRSGDAVALEPVPKLQNKKCVSIAAGTSNSFAVTDSGEVMSWGMGSEGQLGTGGSADAAEPTAAPCPPPAAAPGLPAPAAVPAVTPCTVSAGGQHTVLLVEDPSSQKEASPAPAKETVEETEESAEEEKEKEEEEEKKPPPRKRQRKQQEEEVSSTSSAQPSEIGEDKPPKVNGDENKETPMEVDATDKPQETKEETTKEEEQKDKAMDQDQEQDKDQEPEQEEKEPSKPETTDTSSQETTDSETKSQDDEKTIDKIDVEMKDERAEVNGTPESQIVEAKSVEGIVSCNPLTTTA